jgi:hypothetical protein
MEQKIMTPLSRERAILAICHFFAKIGVEGFWGSEDFGFEWTETCEYSGILTHTENGYELYPHIFSVIQALGVHPTEIHAALTHIKETDHSVLEENAKLLVPDADKTMMSLHIPMRKKR